MSTRMQIVLVVLAVGLIGLTRLHNLNQNAGPTKDLGYLVIDQPARGETEFQRSVIAHTMAGLSELGASFRPGANTKLQVKAICRDENGQGLPEENCDTSTVLFGRAILTLPPLQGPPIEITDVASTADLEKDNPYFLQTKDRLIVELSERLADDLAFELAKSRTRP